MSHFWECFADLYTSPLANDTNLRVFERNPSGNVLSRFKDASLFDGY